MLLADGGSGDSLTPQAAFALLGNEYRAAIVGALGEAQGTEGPRPVLVFSELYERADVDIATSQFNYHLQQLVGAFVEKTDDGYRLRHEGVRLYRTIVAGTYTDDTALEPFPVGVDCYHCDAPITAAYADRRVTIACTDCGREYSDTTAPPSLVSGDRDGLLTRVDQHLRHRILAFSKGVCSVCANGLDTQFVPGEELVPGGVAELDVFVHRSCDHCGAQQYMSVGLSLLYDAGLVSFFQTRGLDVTTTPVWELEFAMTDRHVEIRSTDPWAVALTLDRDDDELVLVLDDEAEVADRELRQGARFIEGNLVSYTLPEI
jgi:hypothetical protein